MKSLVLKIAVGVLLTGGAAFAQPSMGVKAGVGWSLWTGDDGKEGDGVIAWSAGGFVKIPIIEQLGVQAEVLASARNWGYEREGEFLGGATKYTEDWSFLWLDVPILVVYNVTPELALGVGPMFSYFLKGTIEREGSFEEVGVEASSDIEREDVAELPIALTADVSFQVNENISVGVRYNLGLTTIVDDEGLDVKSGSVLAMVGFGF